MGVDQHERAPGPFTSVADLDLDAFIELCEQDVDAGAVPTAAEIVRKVPVYAAAALRTAAKADRREIMAELNGCFLDGPGVLAVRGVIDPAVVDAASVVYRELIDEEARAGRAAGDHFAAPGKNERLWNSFQKLADRAPSTFIAYFANPVIDLVCESWLGPGYRMTAQVNVVHPGGDAQRPHRDYHLGFLSDDEAARYPLPIHRASALLTLQGAVAHTDMAVESGPTRLLPFSQRYDHGFLAYRDPAFEDYFSEHVVQLPLSKGDLLFFNPALFHAAGDNRTADVVRTANLLQVSSAFGKPMETIDTTGIILRCFDDLRALHERNSAGDELEAALTMVADGYPFPGNLDSTPPTGGLAPPSQRELLRRALDGGWTFDQLSMALASQEAARSA
jgi:ectoine hydroxylase-related dioxygenase (phytanoyl-CoA dioxygenase family)